MGFQRQLPAGTYFIGDPGHVLSRGLYQQIMDQMFNSRGSMVKKEGLFRVGDAGVVLVGTPNGDGEFEDTDGYQYGVDSGMIGIVPRSLTAGRVKTGRWETFQNPVTFRTSKTSIVLSSDKVIKIAF